MIGELIKRGARRPNVVVVLGKGGVGKTTVSMLIGLSLSRGNRVLLVSLDPAKHLAEYVGPEVLRGGVSVGEGLTIRQVDVESEVRKYAEKYAQWVSDIMPSLKVFNVESAVDAIKYSPGVEEEVFLNVLSGLYKAGDYDYVVVDTPPTGIALRTLNLPALYSTWLDKLIEVRERIVALRYSIARALGRAHELKDRVLEKLYELRHAYGELYEELKSPEQTSYVLVATPEPLPVYELRESARFLKERLGNAPKLLVLNKYLPEGLAREMGVLETQERYLSELKSMGAPVMVVEYLGRPTRSIRDVYELAERARVA